MSSYHITTTEHQSDLHVEVDDDVDGEGGVARHAGVGPRRRQGSLRPGGGRVRSSSAGDRRVERLLVPLAHRAPGCAHGTAVEGGDGVQGLKWVPQCMFQCSSNAASNWLGIQQDPQRE